MLNNEDLDFELNLVFSYMIKKKVGKIDQLITDLDLDRETAIIVINLLSKNEIIIKYKEKSEMKYSLKKKISPITYGKAISLGLDINVIEKYFELDNGGTLEDVTKFINNGSLEQAIKIENERKKEAYIKNVENQTKTQVAATALGERCIEIKNVIAKLKNDENLDLSVLNLLQEVEKGLSDEFKIVYTKLKDRKISTIKE